MTVAVAHFPTDIIYCADARHMRELPDASVHLVVTSPPYNVGKPYEGHKDDLPLDEYLPFSIRYGVSAIGCWCRAAGYAST